jgi:hypothetical protein
MLPLAWLGYPLHGQKTQPFANGSRVDPAGGKYCTDATQPAQETLAG